MCRQLWEADTVCFDSTAACAALLLSMTGVERINKVTHSQDDILVGGGA